MSGEGERELEQTTKVEGGEALQSDLSKTEAAKELEAAVEGAEDEGARPAQPAQAAKPEPSWEVRKLKERLAKVTAAAKEREEELARLKAASPRAPEEELERQVDERATEKAKALAAQMKFNEDTMKVLTAGRKAFEDFDAKVEAMRMAVLDQSDPESSTKYVGLVSGVLETAEGDPGVAAKLIHSLGSDPELAERLLSMSPVRLGKELARLAEVEPPEPPSRTPRPPSVVVGGRSPSHVQIDPSDPTRASSLSMREWMARREAQVKEQQKLGVRMR